MRLTKQMQETVRRQFSELGYFHAKAVFTPQEIALLETEFDFRGEVEFLQQSSYRVGFLCHGNVPLCGQRNLINHGP